MDYARDKQAPQHKKDQESTLRAAYTPTDEEALYNLLQKIEKRRPGEAAMPKRIRTSARLQGKRLLGRGGLGSVYRFVDPILGRDLALKVARRHILASPQGIERFTRERLLTARLNHPAIPPVHHCGQLADGRPYYVMRLIRGRSLAKVLSRRAKPPADYRTDAQMALLLDAFERVCEAVQYAHEAGVIHRDIKPANIMLEKHGAAFLVDWGLARETTTISPSSQALSSRSASLAVTRDGVTAPPELTQQAYRIGSPDYMSPEQADGSIDKHGPATDVYGLGATLYCILTGWAPHATTRPDRLESREEMYERIASTPPLAANELVPQLPAALASICHKALEREPERRYASAQAMREDLVRWRQSEVVLAHG